MRREPANAQRPARSRPRRRPARPGARGRRRSQLAGRRGPSRLGRPASPRLLERHGLDGRRSPHATARLPETGLGCGLGS
ncbi:hypothetical protein FJ251_12720 [bacterium]|nr:hypothetical protein [bacterium]